MNSMLIFNETHFHHSSNELVPRYTKVCCEKLSLFEASAHP